MVHALNTLSASELTSFILMEKIRPPSQRAVLLRRSQHKEVLLPFLFSLLPLLSSLFLPSSHSSSTSSLFLPSSLTQFSPLPLSLCSILPPLSSSPPHCLPSPLFPVLSLPSYHSPPLSLPITLPPPSYSAPTSPTLRLLSFLYLTLSLPSLSPPLPFPVLYSS
jgi:hypothetical protein